MFGKHGHKTLRHSHWGKTFCTYPRIWPASVAHSDSLAVIKRRDKIISSNSYECRSKKFGKPNETNNKTSGRSYQRALCFLSPSSISYSHENPCSIRMQTKTKETEKLCLLYGTFSHRRRGGEGKEDITLGGKRSSTLDEPGKHPIYKEEAENGSKG